MAKNGLFTNDGESGAWTALGEQTSSWIQTIHVAKKGDGKRLWVTKATPISMMDPMTGALDYKVHYYARYSDDNAVTWTEHEFTPLNQFGPEDPDAAFMIVAVAAHNPDHIYALIKRYNMPDDLVFSPMRGEPGSWMKLATLTELGGLAFDPSGAIYYGDTDQTTWGTFVIAKPGDTPKQLATWPAGCLSWDEAQERMLACNRWQFGTLSLDTGNFNVLYDMRCGQTWSSCANLAGTCEAQVIENWCHPTHYPASPLCSNFIVPDADYYVTNVLDYTCKEGRAVPRTEGGTARDPLATAAGSPAAENVAGAGGPADASATGGASSSGTSAPAAAGTFSAGAPAPVAASKPSSRGCSAVATHAESPLWSVSSLSLGLLWLTTRRRTRSRS